MPILTALLLLAPLPDLPAGATPPVPTITPFDAINPEDFPAEANPDDTALLYVRLDVNAKGQISACDAVRQEVRGHWAAQQWLDLTCKLLRQRVQFVPARDVNGRAIPSFYVDGIAWDRVVASDGRLIKGPPLVRLIWPRKDPSATQPIPAPATKITPRPAMPKGNAAGWIMPADYPATLKNGEAGRTQYRLTIGPDGRVYSCMIVKSSGVPSLDERACMLTVRRARFSPATDENGNTVEGAWTGKVEWKPPQ